MYDVYRNSRIQYWTENLRTDEIVNLLKTVVQPQPPSNNGSRPGSRSSRRRISATPRVSPVPPVISGTPDPGRSPALEAAAISRPEIPASEPEAIVEAPEAPEVPEANNRSATSHTGTPAATPVPLSIAGTPKPESPKPETPQSENLEAGTEETGENAGELQQVNRRSSIGKIQMPLIYIHVHFTRLYVLYNEHHCTL